MSKNSSKQSDKANIKEDTDFKNTIEFREKRIGIVFKVIYVLAIFLGYIFIDISKRIENGINLLYICESCEIVLIFAIIVQIVLYIVNEMKCLKINPKDVSKDQIESTEESYLSIFSYGFFSLISTFIGFVVAIISKQYVNEEKMVKVICVLSVLSLFCLIHSLLSTKDNYFIKSKCINTFISFLKNLLIIMLLISILLYAALVK